ncbi:acyl-CoA dehydrogenase [Cryobacterium glaciale]|uniref:Acyl-CoA dehydrogenase n=1 Tax=Cryobacterium glaciale TaxID=1259145 RepID=A0A4R8V3U5_9MICO|nr:acyl-CoA dehydrogenase family protein [Cryobacterium glaciale]TFB77310.1 acyl-CoA dehydrogenase [Cryobacterium glaciale]
MNVNAVPSSTVGEIGLMAAEAVRELALKATGGSKISTYVEGPSPLAWNELVEGGWDLAGIVENGEGATRRDLVEIAIAWGEQLIPLPFMLTIVAKRHSPASLETDAPLTMALPIVSLPSGRSYLPFGQLDGILLVRDPGGSTDGVHSIPAGQADDLALSLHGIEADEISALSPQVARDVAIVLVAECVGGARQLLADGVSFVGTREQFGQPIGSFQAIKHHLANALIAVELAESTTIWASVDDTVSAAVLLFAVDQCIKTAEIVVQVHGGLGFTWEMGLHFYLRHMMMVREMVPGLIQLATIE